MTNSLFLPGVLPYPIRPNHRTERPRAEPFGVHATRTVDADVYYSRRNRFGKGIWGKYPIS